MTLDISKTLKQAAFAGVAASLLAASGGLAQTPAAQAPGSKPAVTAPLSPQEVEDERVVSAALADFTKGRMPALQAHLPALREVMAHAPRAYPRFERRGDIVIIRSDAAEFPALSLLVMMKAAADGGSGFSVVRGPNTYPLAAMMLSSYAIENKQPAEASAVLDRALAMQPDGVPLIANKGTVLGLQDRWAETLSLYDAGLGINLMQPVERAALLRGKGAALTELNRLDEAEMAYRDSLKLLPGNATALSQLTYIAQRRNGRPATAPTLAPIAAQSPAPAPAQRPAAAPVDIAALTARANAGQGEAMYRLGMAYVTGRGVARNEPEAARWLRLAADKGHLLAMVDLGVMFENGEGLAVNPVEAVRWYRAAADQGEAAGMKNLAAMYARGKGVEKNASEAARWYQAAADKGDVGSLVSLGNLHAAGDGMPKDEAQAARLFRQAADKGAPLGMRNLGVLYAGGRGVAKDPAEAMRWFKAGADKGDARCLFNIGSLYANGEGVTKDQTEAARWIRMAADKGDAAAMNALGTRYEIGLGVAKDPEEAKRWRDKATAAGFRP